MRGMITPEITAEAERLLGIKNITARELRLMPYIQFTMVNSQRLDPARINAEERGILAAWRKRGWIEGGAAGMWINEDFWNAINRLIWMAYVAY